MRVPSGDHVGWTPARARSVELADIGAICSREIAVAAGGDRSMEAYDEDRRAALGDRQASAEEA